MPLADVAEALLEAPAVANVAPSNCPAFAVTDGEWALVTGAADRLAYEALGLTVEDRDARVQGEAFALPDRPGTCAAEGPRVQPLLRLLEDMGGSRVPAGPVKG